MARTAKSRKTETLTSEREVRTYADLQHGAWVFLSTAKQSEAGQHYTTMAALLLTAFTFEAYLNHLGEWRLKLWRPADRMSVMDKYEVVCKHLKLSPKFGARPYQTLRELFSFRNAMAHGRSAFLTGQKVIKATDDPYKHQPKPFWEKYCTVDNAERALEDVDKVVVELSLAAKEGARPFLFGPSTFVLTRNRTAKPASAVVSTKSPR